MHTFKKAERLCSRRLILRLMQQGASFFIYPFKVHWMQEVREQDQKPGVQLLFSVAKRRFVKSPDRNRIKRLLRESYRLNKTEQLYPFIRPASGSVFIAISYVATSILPFKDMQKKLLRVLAHLAKDLQGS